MAEVLDKKTKVAAKAEGISYDKATYLKWYEIMYRIRRFEEKTLFAYSQQKIRGFCHVYIGQEAIGAALASGLKDGDKVVTAYRQHGVALARGLESKYCMAELYGKSTGCVKGKGGSMHFFSKEKGYFGGNGIVGAQIPIGTGIAFAEQYKGTDNLAVCMFGDGAARQGSLHESFNMAMTWKLPVLYICENNQYAMGTSVKRTSNVQDLWKLGLAYDMPSEPVDGMNPESVHEAFLRAAEHIRSGKGPYYLEIRTYRYRGHSVSDPAKYRTKDELEHYKEQDPVVITERKIIDNAIASEKEVNDIKEAINLEIDEAMAFAEASDYPLGSELYEDNYMQKDYPFIMD
ncbi:MAG: pyruvate dehydrogenase (acetyl-transferring) E1 component subunit alpha [Saprospiraceae bacterium]|nr:pyruvate dehydrogenase (acetyl-transferring) E1 component subunit alpha [Saprospiraceae bacterium]MBK8635462.1 pyruvate dehydrogenase (acetyl-transferring) E1 component subunit alpha [Saprospiraceae bacterium]MBP7644963.1 pyruvate dehydrogenase (acetyl-transferring) E1 component subunit alpha [Saprospiraceae bacterium]HMS70454.1 pyruvate dehydrogenase (acetyl-transferring) E1 component subunit alpha [Saprospiraceae bacterium]